MQTQRVETAEQRMTTLENILIDKLPTLVQAFKTDVDKRWFQWSLKHYASELIGTLTGQYAIDSLSRWLKSDTANSKHGTAFLDYLAHQVIKNDELCQALSICTLNDSCKERHVKLFLKHNIAITHNMPILLLEKQNSVPFVMDYLKAALPVWQQVQQEYLDNSPFYECFARIPKDVWQTNILCYLDDADDLRNLATVANEVKFKQKATPKAGQYVTFLGVVNQGYCNKLHPLAETLKQHLYKYEYDEVKTLIEQHPLVLTIKTEYYSNRWAEQEGILSLGQLSALEYAWRMGDANFIDLFNGYHDRLPAICFDRKGQMDKEWEEHRDALAKGFEAYGEGGAWADFRQMYYGSPQWVYGLVYYMYQNDIREVKDVNKVIVVSDNFRSAAPLASALGLAVLCCPPYTQGPSGVAAYLSRSHTRTRSNHAASKLTEQSIDVNNGQHSPGQ